MHPTVIGLRAERVLGPGPIANRSDELLTFNLVNLPEEGLNVKANSSAEFADGHAGIRNLVAEKARPSGRAGI